MKTKLVHLLVAVALVVSLVAVAAVGTATASVNTPPVAQAGQDQVVHGIWPAGGLPAHYGDYPDVLLDGTPSFDLNRGDTLTYKWTVVPTPPGAVSFDDDTSPTPVVTLTEDKPGTYVFKLTVTDSAGATDTDTVQVIAGLTWFVRICGMDSWDGTAYEYHGPSTGPWRTITWATSDGNKNVKDGDRIIVGPTPDPECGGAGAYGINGHPENIVVNKSLTIQSKDGRGATVVNVTPVQVPGQPCQPPLNQVVLITADGVVFGCDGHGFTLKGAPVGIRALGADYIYIHQNEVDICEAQCYQGEYAGILVDGGKMPIIEDNIVDACCVDSALGIGVSNADVGVLHVWGGDYIWSGARVIDNEVTVEARLMAWGISLYKCPEAYVAGNMVDLTAGPSCAAWGIVAQLSDKIQIVDNDVTVLVNGGPVGAGFGIEVVACFKALVADNDVDVTVYATAANMGGLLGVGIHMVGCDWSNIDNNIVEVYGSGEVTSSMAVLAGEGISALDAQELDGLNQAIEKIIGRPAAVALGAGLVAGIAVCDSDLINVTNNSLVSAEVDLCVRAVGDYALGAGGAFAFGISVLFSLSPDVINNGVRADAYVDVIVSPPAVEETGVGIGAGLAGGFGIVVAFCPPDYVHGTAAVVANNEVQAYGEVLAQIWAQNEVFNSEAGSALDKLDSDVLNAIYEIVTQSAENEVTNVQISGEVQRIGTFAAGGALAIGVGITALMSDGISITANNPVIGQGTVDLTVVGLTDVSADFTGSLGGGLGLGIGILVSECNKTVIANNGICSEGTGPVEGEAQLCGVIGRGMATVDVEAAVITYDLDCAAAVGGGAGVGLGILVTGLFTQGDVEQATAPGAQPEFDAVITGNVVDAYGNANVLVEAYDMRTDGSASALGAAVGVGGGIAVTALGCVYIAGNTVDALGEASADVYAAGISAEDPEALGVSCGLGFGIAAGVVGFVGIVGNTADAVGTAAGTFMAVEEAVLVEIEDASAFGTTIGAGLGIAIANSGYANVSQNHASGVGNSVVVGYACDLEALEWAWATALAFANGEGIALLEICGYAQVQESNTFEAGANVDIDWLAACANYPHACGLGSAVAIDALFVFGLACIDFNYNDMPGLVLSSAEAFEPGVAGYQDLGMLAVGVMGAVDARYNWWGDATGPSLFGPGNGQGVAWCVCYGAVAYEPWLYVEHQVCLDDHMGRFGFAIPLHSCWNTFSTPIALSGSILAPNEDPVNTFGGLLSFSDLEEKVTIAYWFDSESQNWVQVLDEDVIEPLNGMYIKMNADGNALLLTSMSETLPTRDLEEGWNLIGPNPPFCWTYQPVCEAVSSIADSEYCAFVLSPAVGGQASWVWTPGSECDGDQYMEIGQAYWVWMNGSDTLAGFGFTPVRDLYPCGSLCAMAS